MAPTIEQVLRDIHRELTPAFEARLRAELATKDRDWLVEQIVRLTLDRHSLHEMDRQIARERTERRRAERRARLREWGVDEAKLDAFIRRWQPYDRARFEGEGYLIAPPVKGTALIPRRARSDKGQALIREAKDLLFAILFGLPEDNVHFDRVEQELLTLTVPRAKLGAFDFLRAATELSGYGTWQDSENISHDDLADNVMVQVEYGELASERIGDGIIETLRIINNLEVNEQILYARMINVEQSSLIT